MIDRLFLYVKFIFGLLTPSYHTARRMLYDEALNTVEKIYSLKVNTPLEDSGIFMLRPQTQTRKLVETNDLYFFKVSIFRYWDIYHIFNPVEAVWLATTKDYTIKLIAYDEAYFKTIIPKGI